jgi:hypothetical protein
MRHKIEQEASHWVWVCVCTVAFDIDKIVLKTWLTKLICIKDFN